MGWIDAGIGRVVGSDRNQGGLRFRALASLLLGYHMLQQIGAAIIIWW